jgi:hypothetical protein
VHSLPLPPLDAPLGKTLMAWRRLPAAGWASICDGEVGSRWPGSDLHAAALPGGVFAEFGRF